MGFAQCLNCTGKPQNGDYSTFCLTRTKQRERITFLYLVAVVFRGQTNVQLDFTTKERCSTYCQQETEDLCKEIFSAKVLSSQSTARLYCWMGLFQPRCRASCFPWLNSLMFLSVHFLSLFKVPLNNSLVLQ